MRAAVLEVVKQPVVIKQLPDPRPGPNEVLIELKAAALNRRDLWIVEGLYPGITTGVVLGSDGAGVVVEVGSEVSGTLVGQEVIINPGWDWGGDERAQGESFRILGMPDNGTFAEYIVVPVEYVYPKPRFLNWHEAAALPLGGVTAYRATFTQGQLAAADKLLITGIGGGVATFVLQYGTAAEAEVAVTSSAEEKLERALKLGARAGYNYTEKDWARALLEEFGPVDLVIDGAGGQGFLQLVDVLAPGGRLVNYGVTSGVPPTCPLPKIFWRQLRIIGSTMGSPRDFERMLDFVNRHRIRPIVDRVFALSEVAEAMDYMRRALQFGKIVLEIG